MSSYEARRLENIKRNQSLVRSLGLREESPAEVGSQTVQVGRKDTATRRRKVVARQPTRASARLAKAPPKPNPAKDHSVGNSTSRNLTKDKPLPTKLLSPQPPLGLDAGPLMGRWSSWAPSAPPPTRDREGDYHFESHPSFTPNKSPEAIIREGSFGGSYWRPLYSRHLRTTIEEDWRELPESWYSGLSVERYLASPTYDSEINKYGVACGQSIEEWELNGWIAHEYDVRGWFQWYCRFWLGRRCADDERQIGRWSKCVGETGRWRRTLLKKYVQSGISSVADEGNDGDGGDGGNLSPAIHQTCHHWAWEVRQEALDRFWDESK